MPNYQQCHACQGRGLVGAGTQFAAACPVCGGSGMTEPPYHEAPYFYVVNRVLTASQRITDVLRIDARADFKWVWAMATQTGTFRTRIKDSSGRNYDNAPVNNANQWGTAQLPLAFIVPVRLLAQSSLEFELEDTSVAGNTVQLVLAGYELIPILRE